MCWPGAGSRSKQSRCGWRCRRRRLHKFDSAGAGSRRATRRASICGQSPGPRGRYFLNAPRSRGSARARNWATVRGFGGHAFLRTRYRRGTVGVIRNAFNRAGCLSAVAAASVRFGFGAEPATGVETRSRPTLAPSRTTTGCPTSPTISSCSGCAAATMSPGRRSHDARPRRRIPGAVRNAVGPVVKVHRGWRWDGAGVTIDESRNHE